MAGLRNAPNTRAGLAALAAVLLVLLIPASAAAAPGVAKVNVTFQVKSIPHSSCERCIVVSGRVASPKSACRSHRQLEKVIRYRTEVTVYRDPYFGETDSQGRWSIGTDPGAPLAWMKMIVPKQRVGAVVCEAAQAKLAF